MRHCPNDVAIVFLRCHSRRHQRRIARLEQIPANEIPLRAAFDDVHFPNEIRTERAEERGVDPQVIVPGHCTEPVVEALLEHARAGTDLSRMLLQVEGFGAFRVERYLDGLRALLTPTG